MRQPDSQQAAAAVFQLPGAPGMQREPRRAAAQTCVREQRALSVPKKQPRGDFHSIGPSATAAAAGSSVALHGAVEGAQRCASFIGAEKEPFVIKYYVVLRPTVP